MVFASKSNTELRSKFYDCKLFISFIQPLSLLGPNVCRKENEDSSTLTSTGKRKHINDKVIDAKKTR